MNRAEITSLAIKAQQGDKAAIEAIYKEFREKVYFFILRIVAIPDTAEDLTSDTFSTAIENIKKLRSGESFIGWLYSIAYSKCVGYIKESSRSLAASSSEELDMLIEGSKLNEPILLPDDYAVNQETKAQLKEIIDSLPADMRAAVIMYYYDEMTIPEVSAALETNDNNTRQKLFQARKKIKAKVEKLIGKDGLFAAVPMSAVLENLSDGVWIAAGTALAVGLTAGLNKASGGIGDVLLYITRKYWAKHKKSLAALLFSGVLLCAVITCIFLNARQGFIRGLDDLYDTDGFYSLMVTDDRTDVIDAFAKEDSPRGEIHVLGTAGIGKTQFHIGTLDDPENLAHFPIEQGRLPEKEGELAAYRSVLDKIGFFGKVGDKITLDKGTFTLVGILHDEMWDYRAGTDLHIQQVYGGDVFGGAIEDRIKYYVPMMYIGGDHSKEAEYTWVMLDDLKGISWRSKEDNVYDDYNDGFATVFAENNIEFEYEESYRINNKGDVAFDSYYYLFLPEVRKMLPLYISAFIIAALSVIAVMRSIFAERENTVGMLRKVGISKRGIRVIFAFEYLCLTVIQTVIGLALGSAAHLGIYLYQINMLDMKHFTGFTKNEFASYFLPDPLIIGAVVSAAVLLVGYLFAALLSRVRVRGRRHKKAASLHRCVARIFRTRAVTIIQTAALALICFGTVYGYILFHNSQGSYDEQTGEFVLDIDTKFGDQNQFDFNEESAEEYYYASGELISGSGNFNFTLEKEGHNGIDDTYADKLGNTVAKGSMKTTFLIADSESGLKHSIVYGSKEEKQFMIDNSSDEGKALLSSDKELFKCPTALTSAENIKKLEPYVTSGRIDLERIASGEEVLLILKYGESPFDAGDRIEFASAITSNGFGIDKLTAASPNIGAVITLPKDIDKILRYAIAAGDEINLLTTVTGARAMGFDCDGYTELIAYEKIGDKLPLGTGLMLKSYEQQRHEMFLQNARFYGSLGALVLMMSLLGFSAYFNGIGLKIRLKEYQISVMRAVGTPLKKLKRRLTFDSVKIPVISGAAAFAMVKLAQFIVKSGYNKSAAILKDAGTVFDKIDMAATQQEKDRLCDICNEMQKQSSMIRDEFITSTQLWYTGTLMPSIIILAVMCIITILLTRKSCKMFTPDIASSLAKGRKRQ